MAEILGVLAVLLGGGALTVGLVAASSAATNRRHLQRLARELGDLRRGLGLAPPAPGSPAVPVLRDGVPRLGTRAPAPAVPPTASSTLDFATGTAPLATAARDPSPLATPRAPDPDAPAPLAPPPLATPPLAVAAEVASAASIGMATAPVAAPIGPALTAGALAGAPASGPVFEPVIERAAPAVEAPRPRIDPIMPQPAAPTSFEERVALVWFTRIGALILLIGFGYFFKYATDSGWIGETGRLLVGAAVGASVLVGAELGRSRTRPIFLHVISGVGLGVLYLVVWSAHVLYGLTSAPVAFAGFGAITVVGGALAVRGRAELVLVFSLVGGFLAPILLSTGADEPLGLFVYLLVLGGLAFAASVALGFRIAPWVAIAGTLALTAGWFVTRFALGDAYLTLASRWPALVGTAAITAEWVVVAAAMRRRARDRVTPDWLVLAALLYAHGCAAVLLHDAPPLLAVVTAGLAVLGARTLLRTRRDLLAVPLVASALVLAVADRTDGWAAVETLAGCGTAMAIYVLALLRDQWGEDRRPDVASLLLVGGASAGFVLVAASVLFVARPHAFALVVVGVAAAQIALALAARRPLLALITAGAGLVGLAMVALELDDHVPSLALDGVVDGTDTRFVAIAAAWAALHVGAAAWELLVRRVAPDRLRLATVSLAALGLPLLAWWTLHGAALPALDGAVLVAFGAILIARDGRAAGTILAAEGVGLLSVATAIQFSGATTVMILAILAAVIVALAAMARDGWWLAGGVILLGIVVLGLLPDELQVAGSWRLPVLANARCATLAVTAAATLAAAFAASRVRTSWFPIASALLTVTGHVVVLLLLLTETADVVLGVSSLMVAATLVLGGYAAVLIALGFAVRNKLHRYLGLGLLAITLGKLALVDIWSLERVYQMLVLLGVGALLVAAGFLYARFGRRLVALLRDER